MNIDLLVLNTLKDLTVGVVARTAQAFGVPKCHVFGYRKFNRKSAVGCLSYPFERIEGMTADAKLDYCSFWELMERKNWTPVFVTACEEVEGALAISPYGINSLSLNVVLVVSPDSDNQAYLHLLPVPPSNKAFFIDFPSNGVLKFNPTPSIVAVCLYEAFLAKMADKSPPILPFVELENHHKENVENNNIDTASNKCVDVSDLKQKLYLKQRQKKDDNQDVPGIVFDLSKGIHVGRAGERKDGFIRKDKI